MTDDITPDRQIVVALRRMWLKSRERSAALKREQYTCQDCGVKKSRAKGKEQKVEVHHIDGIAWTTLIELIRRELLCDPLCLRVLCPGCHKKVE